MNEVHRLPSVQRARREASEWIARLQSDDVTQQEREQFEAWRSAHPRHVVAYDDLMSTWQRFASAGRTVRAVSFGNAMQEASRVKHGRWRALAAAAVTAVLAIGCGWWWQLQQGTAFETGIGEHASIALPDGSRLELNSASKIRVDFTEGARIIRLLEGEAFFTVAHAPERPFWVVADRTWVRAVGTAFNVHRRNDGVRVTVSEGRVKVGSVSTRQTPSDTAMDQVPVSLLGVGQQADLRIAGTSVRALPMPQVEREISWRGGTVYFDDRPLQEVVAEIGRYTPLQIEVGAGAHDLKIGGTFQTNPQGAEALLTMLEDGLELDVQREGGRVHVDSRQ
ncbi:FecR domain-containing protein [Luteimonas sp. RD2P54]|uniref:FecR domain-containing protein n=1 Tax=Luteimonas endophytica TaxID=3042023 RepID=A0ABT6JAP8_9GAMM|nr:FecR domain-containing protein [Luteimonas endophytica]MDH5823907.1 FecR domain-containing protein [Luteimonas endophytica]